MVRNRTTILGFVFLASALAILVLVSCTPQLHIFRRSPYFPEVEFVVDDVQSRKPEPLPAKMNTDYWPDSSYQTHKNEKIFPSDHRKAKLIPLRVDSRRAPTIAICVVATTPNASSLPGFERLSLFAHVLPSIVRTASPGFEYWIFAGRISSCFPLISQSCLSRL